MPTVDHVLAVAMLVVLAACHVMAFPGIPALDDNDEDFRIRDTEQRIPQKPAREDGLGSLLLKNLRFRDLSRRYQGTDPVALFFAVKPGDNDADYPGVSKRQQTVSVSQLAELLHNLKSRGVDDNGVKLQSLRFGK